MACDRAFADAALRDALARAFGVAPGAVTLVEDLADFPTGAVTGVICEVFQAEPTAEPAPGAFPTRLHLYPQDVDLGSDRRAATAFAAATGATCLISDDSPAPYTWIRIGPGGAAERVALDADRLDEVVLSRVPGPLGEPRAAVASE